jgi:DNA-directed RNA polymerase omega subunit
MDTKQLLLDKLDYITLNRYQAVLLAAKRARQLNAERLRRLEMMAEDTEIDIDYRKVTTVALENLLDDKIKVKEGES